MNLPVISASGALASTLRSPFRAFRFRVSPVQGHRAVNDIEVIRVLEDDVLNALGAAITGMYGRTQLSVQLFGANTGDIRGVPSPGTELER